MKDFKALLQNFQHEAKGNTQSKFGSVLGGSHSVKVTKELANKLYIDLLERRKQTNWMTYVSVSLLLIIFGLGVYFAILYRSDPTTLTAILGVKFSLLFSVVIYIQKMRREQTAIDILIAIMPNMAPEEVLRAVLAILQPEKLASLPITGVNQPAVSS